MADKYKVIIQDSAQRDLRGIWDYIAVELREPATAARLLDRLEKLIASLGEMPERHAALKDELLRAKDIRKMPVDNYIVFYHVSEESQSVAVLRVLYGRRDWEHIL